MPETEPAAELEERNPGPAVEGGGKDRGARSAATPMMAQYLAVKEANPGCLLFYRMGDFYELFFEDAVAAAGALDITLTRRGRHRGKDVPMCGVPVHAAETYLERLIRKGFRVAVCEQTEDPAQARRRGAKAVVAREVVRVVTPGTLTEDSLLEARRHNFLAALAEAEGVLGFAWIDISTGAFQAQPLDPGMVAEAMARVDPGELILSDRLWARPEIGVSLEGWGGLPTPLPGARFDSVSGRRRLESHYGVRSLDAFGAFSRAEIAACGAALDYVALTQQGRLPRIDPPRRLGPGTAMEIDAATRRNLEITRSLSGERQGSLLAVIDLTVTGAGARSLAERLGAPSTERGTIERRLDAVEHFASDGALRSACREILAACPDLERAMTRLALGRGGPRDLAAVGEALSCAGKLSERIAGGAAASPEDVERAAAALAGHDATIQALGEALGPNLPLLARDGGFVAAGYDAALDELRDLRDGSRRLIADLQKRYVDATGIASLKIRHNNVLGYFVEVTPTHEAAMSAREDFIHRQTLASARRYTTVALAELEEKLATASDRALARELEIFESLSTAVTASGEAIARTAAALAGIDVTAALAELAVRRRYVRPAVDDSLDFAVTGARHPVVESFLERDAEAAFVPNDCDLGPEQRLWLVTGPNMAGKSTFLRQNALIAILAQIGSFVPAEAARIGIVDRLFSRVGAADDLARGRSTFMVEMVETAAILNQAGPRALVILDEIGRGTATFDGLSIAWATLEHLHEVNRSRALFATHFHELTALKGRLEALKCVTMRVKEWRSEIVFLHEVVPGAASQSYGIHVARLAGLPDGALSRAEAVLETLEQGEQSGSLARLGEDLPLFSATVPPPPAPPSAAEEALAAVNPDEITPREALDLLYRIRSML